MVQQAACALEVFSPEINLIALDKKEIINSRNNKKIFFDFDKIIILLYSVLYFVSKNLSTTAPNRQIQAILNIFIAKIAKSAYFLSI